MDGLPMDERGAGASLGAFSPPLSGFGGARQSVRLTALAARLGACLALIGVALVLAAPVAQAADPPGVPAIRPAPRALPPQRMTPRPPLAAPRIAPNPALGLGRSVNRPTFRGPNCRASCGSRCQMVACGDLNVSQCASVRQRCRMACNSRC